MLKEISWRFLRTKIYIYIYIYNALELDKEAIIDPLSFGIAQFI